MLGLNKRRLLLKEKLAKLKEASIGDVFLEQECEFIEAKMNSEIYNIVVVGHFSTGKSTFINALMGGNLLPTSVKETTAVTTKIFSVKKEDSRVNKAAVKFKKGKVEWVDLNGNQETLKKYATLLQTQMDVAANIEVVEVYRTIPLLGEHICLVDTPGDNGITERIFEYTKNEIEKAAAIIYLMPSRGVSSSDARLLNYINQYQERVFFVVNQLDVVPKEEHVTHLQSIALEIEKISIMKSTPVVYGLSSKNALKGRMEHYQPLVMNSGILALEEKLFQYIEKQEYQQDFLTSIEKDFLRLEQDIDEATQAKQLQESKVQEQRQQIQTRIENIVRRMRLEYDELEQGLLLYMRNETEQIVKEMSDKKEGWVEQISPSFQSEATVISTKLKNNLMALLKKDWKDMDLFVKNIKIQIIGLNKEINELANKKYNEFIQIVHRDTVLLEEYVPKRNRVVIELIMQANQKKKKAETRFSRLVNELTNRQFQFKVNQDNQVDKRFQPIFKLEEEKTSRMKESKLAEQKLEQLSEKIAEKSYEQTTTQKDFERETRRLGAMPKVETYTYYEEVSRKGLGKILDLFSTKTVKRTGRDDSRQQKWIKDKESLERTYERKLEQLSSSVRSLQSKLQVEERLKRMHDREVRKLEEQSEDQMIDLMEDLHTSYREYAKKCIEEFHLVLNQQATGVYKECTKDLSNDRKEVNETIKKHVRERVTVEEKEIRGQHAYLLEGEF
ncbi:dynamin family protein [Niallia sp. Sow4_A1]|uniref:dynamin family protein n=1 Tax=unclassified Niallia TaxID=2837522 RepID=UPI00204147C3|nr:dynamin family protein [Niallia sp. MER TA 168]MCM3364722.1 dynamin family protein [Niallia sp. MER TA 168]